MNQKSCATCGAQIRRLKSKPFFDTLGEEGVTELVSTLHSYGHARAEEIISEALILRFGGNDADRVPGPADLWTLCRLDRRDFKSLTSAQSGSEVPPGCPTCGGRAHIQVLIRGEYGARRCTCARGQYFAAKDRDRRAKEVPQQASDLQKASV